MNGKMNGESTLQGKLSMPMTYFELDTEMSDTSNNPVANSTIKKYIDSADRKLKTDIEILRTKLDESKDIFFVGCSLDAETSEIIADTTVADLTNAIDNDKLPVLVLDTNTWFNLVHHTSDGKFVFQTMSSDGLIEIVCIDDVWTIEYLDFVSAYKEMKLTDEQKEIARKNIGALSDTTEIPTNVSDLQNDEGYLTENDLCAVAKSNSYNDLDDKPSIPTFTDKKWYELNSTTLSADANFVELELPEGYEEYIFQIYSPMPTESSPAVLYPYANYDNNGTHTAIVLPQWNYAAGLYSHWLSVTLKTVKMGDTLNFQIESVSRFAGNTNTHNPQQDGDVKKSQLFSTDEGRTLVEWARVRYERKLLAGTQYKLYGLK